MNYLSLFSGIGAFEKAMNSLDIKYNLVAYCDIDRNASKAYSSMYSVPEAMNLVDVTKVNAKNLPEIDLLTYGFPCQDISHAGYRKGLFDESGNKTRSGLFFDALRIIEEKKPKIAIAENVKNLVSKKFENEFRIILESLNDAGYNNYWKVLNSKDFGIPQNRPRVFIVSIRKDIDNYSFTFPTPVTLNSKMVDYLDDGDMSKYILSDKMFKYVLDLDEVQKGTKWEGRANNDYINPAVAHGISVRGAIGQRAGVSNVVSVSSNSPIRVIDYKNSLPTRENNHDLRWLTEKECFRLMGFSDEDFEKALIGIGRGGAPLYARAGNSICVNVAEHLFSRLIKSGYIDTTSNKYRDYLNENEFIKRGF